MRRWKVCLSLRGVWGDSVSILKAAFNIEESPLHVKLSHFFKQHRSDYYEHLQSVRDRGDWESWLAFFLRGVINVSREATETARRILALREDHRATVTSHLGRAAGNGHRVLESLYQRPIVSVAEIQNLTGTTYTAANNLVSRLVKLEILQEATGYKRNRVFRYAPYISLFGDNAPNQSGETEGTTE